MKQAVDLLAGTPTEELSGELSGNDIQYFQEKYRVTGSDLSEEFLLRCRNKFSDIPFKKLSAVSIDTNEVYECIFSNKVLHHLDRESLEKSLKRQQRVITANGIFAHTFWLGDKEFSMEGMFFIFYRRDELLSLASKYFNILETYEYSEIEEGDSIFIVAKNDKFA